MVRILGLEVEHRIAAVLLAAASAARTQSSAAQIEGLEQRNFDSSTFDAWFTAYTLGDPAAMELAARRFRPEFRVAFDAWQATDPANNAQAPPGPTFMDEYEQPFIEKAAALDERATAKFEAGEEAGQNADKYVQTTVYLATVLFLVGISGHFRVRKARIGLRRGRRDRADGGGDHPGHPAGAPVNACESTGGRDEPDG